MKDTNKICNIIFLKKYHQYFTLLILYFLLFLNYFEFVFYFANFYYIFSVFCSLLGIYFLYLQNQYILEL